jgi:hypothetical protein
MSKYNSRYRHLVIQFKELESRIAKALELRIGGEWQHKGKQVKVKMKLKLSALFIDTPEKLLFSFSL